MLPEARNGFTKRTDERFYTIAERTKNDGTERFAEWHGERRDRRFAEWHGELWDRRFAESYEKPLKNLIFFRCFS